MDSRVGIKGSASLKIIYHSEDSDMAMHAAGLAGTFASTIDINDAHTKGAIFVAAFEKDLSGPQRLMRAMIYRAGKDLVKGSPEDRRSAMAWVFKPTGEHPLYGGGCFPFDYACQALDICPMDVRLFFRAMIDFPEIIPEILLSAAR